MTDYRFNPVEEFIETCLTEEDFDFSDFIEKCCADQSLIIKTHEEDQDLIDQSYMREWNNHQKQLKELEVKKKIEYLETEVKGLSKKCKQLEKAESKAQQLEDLFQRYVMFTNALVPSVKILVKATSEKNKEIWGLLKLLLDSGADKDLVKAIALNVNSVQQEICDLKTRFSDLRN